MEAKWQKGEEVPLREVNVAEFMGGISLVVTEGHYYSNIVKLAGKVSKVELEGNRVELKVMARGTTSEGLLRVHSGDPTEPIKVLVCPVDCGHVESGDRLLHGVKGYLLKEGVAQEEWMNNLVAAGPSELAGDELAELRKRGDELGKKDAPRTPGVPEKEDVDEAVGKKKKKKRKKEGKEKKKKKKKKEEGESSSSKPSTTVLDGHHPVTASLKKYQSLFAGTGLDSREKVRRRVARKARKILTKKRSRSKSSSGSSTSSSTETGGGGRTTRRKV